MKSNSNLFPKSSSARQMEALKKEIREAIAEKRRKRRRRIRRRLSLIFLKKKES